MQVIKTAFTKPLTAVICSYTIMQWFPTWGVIIPQGGKGIGGGGVLVTDLGQCELLLLQYINKTQWGWEGVGEGGVLGQIGECLWVVAAN